MSSKLEPHSDMILSMLISGATYKKIVEALSQQDCKTSLTNLNDWVKRRQKRIISRAFLVSPPLDKFRPVQAELMSATSGVGNKTTEPANSESIGQPPIQSRRSIQEKPNEAAKTSSTVEKLVLPRVAGFRTATVGKIEKSEMSKFLDIHLTDAKEDERREAVTSFFAKKTLIPSNS